MTQRLLVGALAALLSSGCGSGGGTVADLLTSDGRMDMLIRDDGAVDGAEEGTASDGTPGDGTPGDGMPGDGAPDAVTPGDGTPGDGSIQGAWVKWTPGHYLKFGNYKPAEVASRLAIASKTS